MTEVASEAAEHQSSIWRWWNDLQTNDRAGRAELRRCGTSAEAAFTAPYHRLLQRLGSRLKETDAQRVAALAAILSHVETEPSGSTSFARQMGTPKGEGLGPRVSDARFRHLLRNEDVDDLLRELVRAVRQLDRSAPVDSMFHDLMKWDEKTRIRWARDFYEQAPLARR